MPDYIVTDSKTGKTLTLRGDSPPTEAELEQIFASQSEPPPTGGGFGLGPALKNLASYKDTVVENLPTIGGALGGILGASTGIPTLGLTSAPAAITGAGVLGAGGEALRQFIHRIEGKAAPGSPIEAAKQIGVEGAIQGASEGGGQIIAKGVGALGKTLLKHAIPVKADVLKKSPNLYENIAKSRTSLSQKGYEAIDQKVKASAGNVRNAVSEFEAANPTRHLPTDDLIEATNPTHDAILRTEDADPNEINKLIKYIDDIRNNPSNGPSLGPVRLQEIKDSADRGASKLYDAAAKGAAPADDFGMSARANVADKARTTLEEWITKGVVPSATDDLSVMNARTQDLGAVRGAVKNALDSYVASPRSPLMRHGLGSLGGVLGGLGGGPLGAGTGFVLGEALASPRVEAAVGRGMMNTQPPTFANLLRIIQASMNADPYRAQ